MYKRKLILASCIIVLATSCTNDSEDDLIAIQEQVVEEDQDGQEGEDLPPSTAITYDNTIAGIVNSSCLGCHSNPPRNGAPFPLVNFSQVRSRANGILSAISRQSGTPGAMPPSGRLPQNTIDTFEEWVNGGTPEN